MSEISARLSTALADRYKLECRLGEGGMATVYLARDLKHDRKVAIKVLRPEIAAIVGADRFLNEIKVTANLHHPHILPLFDSGEADSFLYYVMPVVEGEALREKLDREGRLTVQEATDITIAVADALDYAHRHDVIHRDIKPDNILLHDGQPVLADFGIALAVSQAGGNRLTGTGFSVGTPHYMSPEQASGNADVDARTDVYALASVMYEMLSGEPPHTGPNVQAVLAKALTEDPRPAGPTAARCTASRRSGRTGGVGKVARRSVHDGSCLCRCPDQRWGSPCAKRKLPSDGATRCSDCGARHCAIGSRRRVVRRACTFRGANPR